MRSLLRRNACRRPPFRGDRAYGTWARVVVQNTGGAGLLRAAARIQGRLYQGPPLRFAAVLHSKQRQQLFALV